MKRILAQAAAVQPRIVAGDGDDGANYRVRPPTWRTWLGLLDRAATNGADRGTEAGLRVDWLLEPWIARLVRRLTPDGREVELHADEIAALPAHVADRFVVAGLDLMLEQRAMLGLAVTDAGAATARIAVGNAELVLRPWTFGERNACLRTCLHLNGDTVALDLTAFELGEVAGCARWRLPDGALVGVTLAEAAAWPVPLAETVAEQLERLNEPEPTEAAVRAACVAQGVSHPDVETAQLQLGFGWDASTVAALPAVEAQRLLAALTALGRTTVAGPPPVTPVPAGAGQAGVLEDYTRIVIRDD